MSASGSPAGRTGEGATRSGVVEAPIANVFSWSRSRQRAFEECPRRYYYSYYGSWGGWEESAAERTRLLWRLKQVQSRHMWIGDLVHRTCAFALRFARHHGALPPERDLVKRFDHAMREEFRVSRDGHLHTKGGKHARLFEHELQESVHPAEWKKMHARGVAAVRAFVGSAIVERILAAPRSGWREPEAFGSFVLEDVPVSVRIDFAFEEERAFVVVDWKTGASPARAAELQLACYALYANAEWGVPLERIRLVEVNLVRNEVHEESVSKEMLSDARSAIAGSARVLSAPLLDPERNLAEEEAFPKVESSGTCRRCVFQVPCLGDRASVIFGGR